MSKPDFLLSFLFLSLSYFLLLVSPRLFFAIRFVVIARSYLLVFWSRHFFGLPTKLNPTRFRLEKSRRPAPLNSYLEKLCQTIQYVRVETRKVYMIIPAHEAETR